MINTSSLFSMIDFAGVFVGAMGGALEAKQNRTYQFDFVGVIGLGLISALGGGITRDILLQHGPPLAFTDIRYLLIALAGGFPTKNFFEFVTPRLTRRPSTRMPPR